MFTGEDVKRKILFFIFIFFIVNKIFSLEVFVDNDFLENYLQKIDKDIKFVKDKKNADLILYNSLNKKITFENSFDYSVGIDNILFCSDKKINENIIYSFNNYSKVLRNVTDILKYYKPEKYEYYDRILKKSIKEINSIKNNIDLNKKMILKHGSKYDYLLNEMGIKYINVDKYFIYKEKSYRKYGLKNIYIFEDDFSTKYKNQLKSYGYNLIFVDSKLEGQITLCLKKIIGSICNG